MSNFIPGTVKKIIPRDPPWISKSLKTLLKKKNRLYKNYKKNGYKAEDKFRLDAFRSECLEAIESAKRTYLLNLGNKLDNKTTSPKAYWKIINRVMNKCRAPRIPPLFQDGVFVTSCLEKAKLFDNFFF